MKDVNKLITKLEQFRNNTPPKVNIYFNRPSKKWIIVCDKQGERK